MKIIFGFGVFIALVSFGLQAAENDLCTSNIQSLSDTLNSAATAADVKHIVTQRIAEAKKAKAAGDTDLCIEITRKAMSKLQMYK